ncbi:hypothetical protein QCA50_013255 [Cerrena zonata]|uniref:Uncharacterized protein n=1 Tax=Cerrena zonata TaxID=2478898 RepID=A0AAW0FZ11_9APHY
MLMWLLLIELVYASAPTLRDAIPQDARQPPMRTCKQLNLCSFLGHAGISPCGSPSLTNRSETNPFYSCHFLIQSARTRSHIVSVYSSCDNPPRTFDEILMPVFKSLSMSPKYLPNVEYQDHLLSRFQLILTFPPRDLVVSSSALLEPVEGRTVYGILYRRLITAPANHSIPEYNMKLWRMAILTLSSCLTAKEIRTQCSSAWRSHRLK